MRIDPAQSRSGRMAGVRVAEKVKGGADPTFLTIRKGWGTGKSKPVGKCGATRRKRTTIGYIYHTLTTNSDILEEVFENDHGRGNIQIP